MRPLLRSLLFLGALAAGQNQPAFEVASVKSVDPSGHPSGLPMGRGSMPDGPNTVQSSSPFSSLSPTA
jgi:hypothetical protein